MNWFYFTPIVQMRKWRRTGGEVTLRESGGSQDLNPAGRDPNLWVLLHPFPPPSCGRLHTHISAQTAQVHPSVPSDFSSPCSKCAAHDWGVSGNTHPSVPFHHRSPQLQSRTIPNMPLGELLATPIQPGALPDLLIYCPQEEAKPLAWPQPSSDSAAPLTAIAPDPCPFA